MSEVGFANLCFDVQRPRPEDSRERMYFLNIDIVRKSVRNTGWNRFFRWYGLRYASQMFLFLGLPMRGGRKPRKKRGLIHRKKLATFHIEAKA